ncbi:hypothetical protein CCAX7_11550 [Capsulimonas corticalis]|uniref:NfeD-like C-terminal domain-containing protein n=1 Tax=Capsulimonas corticalis TaxID=2219043 RepID=A0A9N7L1B1_9BACT|nr:hypothetical protein [Capsulimonas corticalis]BDI29104.1 hypothetical protein CCAX7_11550 [Capsulimonas corticalis]
MITTLYQSLLAVGGIGLALQTVLGMGHGHHHDPAAAGGRHMGAGAAHDGGHDAALLHAGRFVGSGARGQGARSQGGARSRASAGRGRASVWSLFAPLLSLLSPLTFFSLCVGAGASGMMLESRHLPSLWTGLGAVAGALIFYTLIVRPIWSFLFRFASKPSEALEGTVSHEAVAMSRFERGKGVVQVNIDGQLVRILANLETDKEGRPGDIEPGEKLLVVSVDGRANSCRVMRI